MGLIECYILFSPSAGDPPVAQDLLLAIFRAESSRTEGTKMDILKILADMPWQYIAAMVALSAYYAWRGVRYVSLYQIPAPNTNFSTPTASGSTAAATYNVQTTNLATVDRWGIWLIQEIVFKVVITISSFCSLYIAYRLSKMVVLTDLKDGTAILLVFLFLWGVLGLSGYLTHLIQTGKFPGSK